MPDSMSHSNPMLQRSVEVEVNCSAADVMLATQFGLLTLTEMHVWVSASEVGNG